MVLGSSGKNLFRIPDPGVKKHPISDPGSRIRIRNTAEYCIRNSVADPDTPDPHVFGPPGSGSISQRYGSGSFYHHAKIVRKTILDSYYFVTLFDFNL
jgi:hypothetical protein